jgi:hypothetical protein
MTMKKRHRFALAAIAGALGLSLACGGTTATTSGSACGDYFDAEFGSTASCPGAVIPPASEVARLRPRFVSACGDVIGEPGSAVTASALEACVAAIKADPCQALDDTRGPCFFEYGTGAAGVACAEDSQCASGSCSAQSETADGGTTGSCGVCAPVVAVGAPCEGTCGANAECGPAPSGDSTICVAITVVAAGGACTGSGQECAEGLVCNPSGVCAAPGGAGAPCVFSEECQAPLTCPSGASGQTTCQPGAAAGAACTSSSDCQPGLGCGAGQTCVAMTWVSAGQPCNATASCLVGGCPATGTTTSGTCPTVIADGQPCSEGDSTTTCDTFATCTGGVCVLGYPTCQ